MHIAPPDSPAEEPPDDPPRHSGALLALTAAATLAVTPLAAAAIAPADSGQSAHSIPIYLISRVSHDVGHNDWAFQGQTAGRVDWVMSYVALGLFWLLIALWIRTRTHKSDKLNTNADAPQEANAVRRSLAWRRVPIAYTNTLDGVNAVRRSRPWRRAPIAGMNALDGVNAVRRSLPWRRVPIACTNSLDGVNAVRRSRPWRRAPIAGMNALDGVNAVRRSLPWRRVPIACTNSLDGVNAVGRSRRWRRVPIAYTNTLDGVNAVRRSRFWRRVSIVGVNTPHEVNKACGAHQAHLWRRVLITAWSVEAVTGFLTLGAGAYAAWTSTPLGPAVLRAADLCSPWWSCVAAVLVVARAERSAIAFRAIAGYGLLLAIVLLVPLPGPDAVKALLLALPAAIPALLAADSAPSVARDVRQDAVAAG